jgi:hypothetical protein
MRLNSDFIGTAAKEACSLSSQMRDGLWPEAAGDHLASVGKVQGYLKMKSQK